MLISHRIFIGLFIWTIISVLISLSAGVEVLVTLEVIGLLVAREFTDGLITSDLRDRLDFFIYAGLFLFIVIVLHRIWIAVV